MPVFWARNTTGVSIGETPIGQPLRKEVILWSLTDQEVSMSFSKVIRFVLIASAVAGVILSLPDIKRYIKISTM